MYTLIVSRYNCEALLSHDFRAEESERAHLCAPPTHNYILLAHSSQVHVNRQAPDVPPDLPADLKAILSRCLLFSPAQRPSLGELKASLTNISFVGEQQVWQS